ncbi:ATP-dependent DNA ligase [Magnetospirillum molischianum]|uniref:Putative DNA ligase (ATP) n=1 Tax=Magnetospirillum molischianum DSM 120 TaxID=1150626 RepID=H8FY82_MAGML|nr:DNA ligase (ATP) [Magnetospirillum molischianum]CCG43320.1 putative DNA ligase (ATP) [Magnetospirillum molischianum DSM 120]
MIGNDIIAILEQIAATASRNDKEAILAKHARDPLLRRVLTYAYDPFRTYGLKKLPKVAKRGEGQKFIGDEGPIWAVFDALAGGVRGAKAEKLVSDWLTLLDGDNATLFERILLKDLRCGISEKTINGVIPGLVPNFACMLAHKFQAKRIKRWPVRADIKEDGFRVLGFVQIGRTGADGTIYDEKVGFFSRSGKPYTTMDHLKAPLLEAVKKLCADWQSGHFASDIDTRYVRHTNATLDGLRVVVESEVVSNDSFAETSSALRKKDGVAEGASMLVFDVVPMSLFDGDDQSNPDLGDYKVRHRLVAELIKRVPVGAKIQHMPSYLCGSEEELMALYERVRARGKEGIIVKPLDGIYERKRSYSWLKIKAEETVDLVVKGAYEGEGKYQGMLGGLLCDFEGVEVRVGGGYSDEERKEFWRLYQHDLKAAEAWGCVGEPLLLGTLVEVEYHETTPDGSLRHPRFVRRRLDKPVADGPGAGIELEAA